MISRLGRSMVMVLPLVLASCCMCKQQKDSGMMVSSPAFAAGQAIPKVYSGEGQDISPPLNWSHLPADTKELALVFDDPSAPTPKPWVHWIAYHIPASATGLPEGIARTATVTSPLAVTNGTNSFSKTGYNGPKPNKGSGVHHYRFMIYALKEPLDLAPEATVEQLQAAMKGKISAVGELDATYEIK